MPTELEASRRVIPQGIDLATVTGDVVKHYSYSELSAYTDDIHKEYVFGKTLNGRFLQGWISQDSGPKYVIIKTWDLYFPPRQTMKWQPRRLHNELVLLTDWESHPNLPKLIGYSIDKKLAVVYDMEPSMTLFQALQEDGFGWEERLMVAIQVANLLKHFHEMGTTIGSIDSMNILVDKDVNIKLCEFGLTACLEEMKYEKDPASYVVGRYKFLERDLYASEGYKWTIRSDMFAFGHLLLDMITKKNIEPCCMESWLYKVLSNDKSDKLSLVDKSLLDDAYIGYIITDLAVKCVDRNPTYRPTAETVYNELKKLAKSNSDSAGSKKCKSYT